MKTLTYKWLLLLVVSFVYGVAVVHSQTPKPDSATILGRMITRYRGMLSYEDRGVIRLIPKSAALSTDLSLKQGDAKQNTLVSFKTYFTAPNHFRFDWQASWFYEGREAAVWSNGKESFSWRPKTRPARSGFTLYHNKSLLLLMEDARSPSAGAVYFVPSLLMKRVSYMPFGNLLGLLKRPSFIGEEQLDGEVCYMISGEINGDPWVLWVGKKTYLLRKLRTLYSFGASFNEGVSPANGSIQVAEENHQNIRVNHRIPKKVFNFRPDIGPHDLDLTSGASSQQFAPR